MFERSLEEEDITIRKIEFSSGVSLRRCLQRGIGITICPLISVEKQLKEGSLLALKTSIVIDECPVLMIYHIDKWCSSLLKYFMNLTKEALS